MASDFCTGELEGTMNEQHEMEEHHNISQFNGVLLQEI